MGIDILKKISENNCDCGKKHSFESEVIVEKGAVKKLPQIIEKLNCKNVFLIADKNTYEAVGKTVCDLMIENKIGLKKYVFSEDNLEPDEKNVGLAIMNFDPKCDVVMGAGSGVINDISKIVSNVSGKKYIIVATAPSMDGYASTTSSMTMAGLKISLPSKCADVIVGDVDILCKAPKKMMLSGLGDMLAKYVSICEWRISNLINGEYFCSEIAELVRASLKKCVDNSQGLLKSDEKAVQAVFEGLVVCGVAMNYAGISRPASGVEHYISHIWDMRGTQFGTNVDFHGIQCAIGTLVAVKLYEKLIKTVPNREKALSYAKNFDYKKYSEELREFVGKGAKEMILLEEKEGKYDVEKHGKRLDIIIENWDKILKIISEEIPPYKQLKTLFDSLGLPKTPEEIGIDAEILPKTFCFTKDIRDKYVLSRLCWDLGIIDEITKDI